MIKEQIQQMARKRNEDKMIILSDMGFRVGWDETNNKRDDYIRFTIWRVFNGFQFSKTYFKDINLNWFMDEYDNFIKKRLNEKIEEKIKEFFV